MHIHKRKYMHLQTYIWREGGFHPRDQEHAQTFTYKRIHFTRHKYVYTYKHTYAHEYIHTNNHTYTVYYI